MLQIHPQTFSRKLMLGKTLDGEFKLLRIRELDNDDVDDKPDSTDEDSPPHWPTSCGAVWSGHWLHRMKYKSM